TAPAVTTTSPADGATDVATNTTLTVNFSESVTATTSSFTLECPSGTPQAYSVSSSPATSFTLTPSSDLPPGAHCVLKVVASQVSDPAGAAPPNHPAADTTVNFTTVDTAPTVSSTTPTDGATDVALNSTVQITFSEPVTLDSGAISLECPSGTAVAVNVTGG